MPPPRDMPPGDVLDALDVANRPIARPNAAGLLWRWRYEFGSVLVVAGAAIGLDITTGTSGLITGAVTAAVCAGVAIWWPASRGWIVARVMCVVVQHRIRTGCAAAWVQTRTGKLPLILWTVPRPFGESVLLWCRAGITAADLEQAREILRVTCWAVDVRVIPDPRRPHRVRLDIIRIPVVDAAATEQWPADDTDPEAHHPVGQTALSASSASLILPGCRFASRAAVTARVSSSTARSLFPAASSAWPRATRPLGIRRGSPNCSRSSSERRRRRPASSGLTSSTR